MPCQAVLHASQQGPPTPRPRASRGLWPVRNPAAQQEVRSGRVRELVPGAKKVGDCFTEMISSSETPYGADHTITHFRRRKQGLDSVLKPHTVPHFPQRQLLAVEV